MTYHSHLFTSCARYYHRTHTTRAGARKHTHTHTNAHTSVLDASLMAFSTDCV